MKLMMYVQAAVIVAVTASAAEARPVPAALMIAARAPEGEEVPVTMSAMKARVAVTAVIRHPFLARPIFLSSLTGPQSILAFSVALPKLS